MYMTMSYIFFTNYYAVGPYWIDDTGKESHWAVWVKMSNESPPAPSPPPTGRTIILLSHSLQTIKHTTKHYQLNKYMYGTWPHKGTSGTCSFEPFLSVADPGCFCRIRLFPSRIQSWHWQDPGSGSASKNLIRKVSYCIRNKKNNSLFPVL